MVHSDIFLSFQRENVVQLEIIMGNVQQENNSEEGLGICEAEIAQENTISEATKQGRDMLQISLIIRKSSAYTSEQEH